MASAIRFSEYSNHWPVKGVQRLPAHLLAQGENLPLADQGRAQHGEEITMPLLGHPNAQLAHPDDIHRRSRNPSAP